MTFNNSESTSACSSVHSAEAKPRAGVTNLNSAISRRAWLGAAATVLASFGLQTIAANAQAAAKTVKLGKATAIPVKGAKSYYAGSSYILVTQPKPGVYKAFSGVCTHEAVNIGNIDGTNLVCSQHGASFDTTTGKVTGGPAPTGLKKYPLMLKSGVLYIQL